MCNRTFDTVLSVSSLYSCLSVLIPSIGNVHKAHCSLQACACFIVINILCRLYSQKNDDAGVCVGFTRSAAVMM